MKLGVMPARLVMMMLGMAGMAMGAMGVMRRLLVIAGFVMFGGFAVMLRGMLMVLGSLVMVLYAFVVAHVFLSRFELQQAAIVYAADLTIC
jgi:hypothetical protein